MKESENPAMPPHATQLRWSANVLYWIHTALFLGITFLFGRLEPIAPLTPLGMNTIGVFLGVLYAWIFIDIMWPSMIGLLALMLLGVMTPEILLNKGFGDPIVVMMLFIFVFCAAINHYGLSRFISLWFITRKCVANRPWLFTFAILGSVSLLGGLTSATPAAIMGWSLLYSISDLCGYEKGDGYPTMMIIGIVFAAQLGMSLIPFKGVPLVALSAYNKLSGLPIDYTGYMLVAAFCCLLCLVLFITLGKFLFRPDIGKLEALDVSRLVAEGALSLTRVQKLVLCFLFALVLCMMAPGFLPGDFAVARFFKTIGMTGICILLVAILCALRMNGKPLLTFEAMAGAGVAWPIIFILAFTLPVAGVMTDPKSGITDFLLGMLQPLFGQSSGVMFAACMGLVAFLMTQFINNTAIAAALMPVVYSYCAASGISPEMPVILVVISVHLAFLTPAASSTAAMLHGNDWVTSQSIWKTAPLLILLAWLLVCAVVVTFGKLLF